MLEFAVYTCHDGWLHVTGRCDGIWRASEHFKAQQDQGGGELPRNQQMLKTDLQRVDRRTRRLREVRQEPRRHDGRHRHRSGRHACRCARHARRDACGGRRDEPIRTFAVISLPTICDKLDMESPNGSADTSTRADANAVAHAMNRTATNCFICFTHIIPFRAAHLPRSMETRLPAASLNIQRIGLRGSPAQFLKNRIHLIHRQASRADIV